MCIVNCVVDSFQCKRRAVEFSAVLYQGFGASVISQLSDSDAGKSWSAVWSGMKGEGIIDHLSQNKEMCWNYCKSRVHNELCHVQKIYSDTIMCFYFNFG